MNSFYEMGLSLREIRDSRLYKDSFSTFEEYCEDKWRLTKIHCYRLIASAGVIDALQSNQLVTPLTESQVRPLTKLDTPELQQQAWQEVVKESNESNEPITAKKVEQVIIKKPGVSPWVPFKLIHIPQIFMELYFYSFLNDTTSVLGLTCSPNNSKYLF